MIAHTSPISGVDVHGNLVATAGYDNRVLLWQLDTRQALARGWHDHLANQCRFDPSGRFLVTASSDYSARIWTVPDLRLSAVLSDHDDDVEWAAFSPDSKRVATASRDGCARIFDRAGNLESVLRGHQRAVLTVEWSQCGSWVYTSSDDGSVRCWNANDGSELERHELDGSETDTIVVAPDGTLVAGNDNGDIVVGLGQSTASSKRGHQAGIKRLSISPSGRCLVSAGYDQSLAIWSVHGTTISLQEKIPVPHIVWARTMAFAGEDTMVFGSFGTSFAALDLTTTEWDLDPIAPTHGLNAIASTNRGLAIVGDAGVVHIDGHMGHPIDGLCNFVHDWQGRIVAGGHAGELRDGVTGATLHRASAPLNCAVVLPIDDRLLVGTYTGQGLVFSSDAGEVELAATMQLGNQAVKGVAASPTHIFAVDAAGGARCFEWPSLKVVVDEPHFHDGIANDVTALADGTFATVGRDLCLRLWSDGQVECHPSPLDHSLKCVAGDRTGETIAVGAYDGSVAIFDRATRRFRTTRRLTTSGISDLIAGTLNDEFWATSYDGHTYNFDADLHLITGAPCSE